MASLRDQIFDAIGQQLGAIDGIGEVARMPFKDPVKFDALHFFDGGQRVTEREAGATRYEMLAIVEGYTEAQGGPEAHGRLSQLYASAVAALMAEPPLGGLAETIDEGALTVDVAPLAGKSRLLFSLEILITYAARRSDPSQPA